MEEIPHAHSVPTNTKLCHLEIGAIRSVKGDTAVGIILHGEQPLMHVLHNWQDLLSVMYSLFDCGCIALGQPTDEIFDKSFLETLMRRQTDTKEH